METNQFVDDSEQRDISHQLKGEGEVSSGNKQEILNLMNGRFDRLETEIMKGELSIFDRNKVQDQIRGMHEERVKKEKQLQGTQVQGSQSLLRELKRDIIRMRQEEAILGKQEAKLKKKQIAEQIKKWEDGQAEIRQKKKVVDAEHYKKQIQQDQKLQKVEKDKQKQRKIQKKKEIAKKMKSIEKNRNIREDILKFSEIEESKLQPKYLQIEKKYKQMEEEMKFEESISKKNHKLSTKIDYNLIKTHEQDYMSRVNERDRVLTEAIRRSPVSSRTTDFTPFYTRNEVVVEEDRKKLKRRLDFQDKVKAIQIDINPERRKEIEIAIDRGQNPTKYVYLSQKALTKEQIYDEFTNFQVNTNGRELGKEYLKELPKLTEGSRLIKANSERTLSVNDSSERFRYKDYLSDLKASRPYRSQIGEGQLHSHRLDQTSKNRIIQKLASNEKRFSLDLQKRQQELQQYNGVKSTLKKVREMDQIYSKSIKAKLTMIQMKQ